MPVDKSQFINSVKQIFDKGMNAAITEGLKASINSENQKYTDAQLTADLNKVIDNMAKKGAESAAKEFVEKVSEDLVKAVDEYIQLVIKHTTAKLIVSGTNGALTSPNGPVNGTILINMGDLKIV